MSTTGYNKGTPDTGWWMGQIRHGLEYRKQYAKEASWDRWRKYYRGEFPAGQLPVNLFFRMLRSVVPQIYFRNPSLSIISTKTGVEQQVFAQLIERIDNKLMKTMNVKAAMKSATHNTWMFGTGAVKLGYGAQFTPTPEFLDTAGPEEYKYKMNRKVEYNSQVMPNMPWLMACPTGSLIVPKGLANFEDTPWVAMWIKRPLDDVQNDPRLKNTAGLTASKSKGLPGMIASNHKSDNPDEIDLVEIRDMRTKTVMIIAPFCSDKVLYIGEDELQNNNRPNIYPIVFNPDDEVFWGVPDSVILEPQQLELNEIRTLTMKHRRMSIAKLLYKKNAIEPGELEKLLNGDVMSAIRVIGEMSDIDTIDLSHIPESLFAADQQLQGDVRDSMGFSRNQAGSYQSDKSHNAPTASEARIVQAAAGIRIDERRDILADVLVNIFEDTNELVFNKWDDEQVIQVMGPDAVPYWVAFKPAMLKAAKYQITIEPDSTEPETKDMRMQKAMQLYPMLKDNPLIDPTLLTSNLLRSFHGNEWDNMMRAIEQNAAQDKPGSTPDNPMGPEDMMNMQSGRTNA